MKDVKIITKGTFYRQLMFNPVFSEDVNEGVFLTASFIDKKNNVSVVKTGWKWIVPGLRYNCRLSLMSKDENTKTAEYKLEKCWVWADDLQVVSGEKVVDVVLNNEPIEALRFGEGITLDVTGQCALLRTYFKRREIQLRRWEDIDLFVEVYREACEKAYKKAKKEVNKKTKLAGGMYVYSVS